METILWPLWLRFFPLKCQSLKHFWTFKKSDLDSLSLKDKRCMILKFSQEAINYFDWIHLSNTLPLCQWTRTNILCKWRTEVQKTFVLTCSVYCKEVTKQSTNHPSKNERHTSFVILFFSLSFLQSYSKGRTWTALLQRKERSEYTLISRPKSPTGNRKKNKQKAGFRLPSLLAHPLRNTASLHVFRQSCPDDFSPGGNHTDNLPSNSHSCSMEKQTQIRNQKMTCLSSSEQLQRGFL